MACIPSAMSMCMFSRSGNRMGSEASGPCHRLPQAAGLHCMAQTGDTNPCPFSRNHRQRYAPRLGGQKKQGGVTMGGWGSGRQRDYRRRPRTDAVQQVDIWKLQQPLPAELAPWVTWTTTLPARVPRPWWCCPGCCRRVRVLYQAGNWRCRTCAGLRYPSQLQGPGDRAATRAKRLRVRLGGDPHLYGPLPPRPRRMHFRTHARLCAQIQEAERQSLESFRSILTNTTSRPCVT
jgi:hypothetical protein